MNQKILHEDLGLSKYLPDGQSRKVSHLRASDSKVFGRRDERRLDRDEKDANAKDGGEILRIFKFFALEKQKFKNPLWRLFTSCVRRS